ncbi:hypothetical protein EXIGLDRAFT_783579 [Exidia glandulosa HHB12029]|uniref:Endonuclease/exonuclease/phosphatase domain-containing protein n=1 Tax=Exidia glandulosa HHB12029 TaxID=1314781 RepID=A0A166MZM3_EXIGL|nr:hypothetical protein EXIGLDRAFT_783579 [Exidia glandulosa HHB12029]
MNRLNEALHALAQDAHDKYDILFIQEPWWGDIGRGQLASVKPGPGWNTLLPQHKAGAGRPRVLTYYRRRRNYTIVPRYDLVDDADAMAVEVRQSGRRPIIYYNVYNQGEADADGRPRGRTTFQRVFIDAASPPVPADAAAVLVGDFNEHHPWWELMQDQPRRQAREMAEWLRDRNFTLTNGFDEPTFASHATGVTSVLDLAFCNPAAGRLDAVYNFRVDAAATGASDHFALVWESPPGSEPVTNVTGCKFNWKLAVEEQFCEALRARLDETGDIIRLIMDDVYMPTTEEAERAAQCFQDAMVWAARKTVPERIDSTFAKPWWNAELDAAKEALAAAKDALEGLTRAAAEAQASVV